jgi:hypothetical protein
MLCAIRHLRGAASLELAVPALPASVLAAGDLRSWSQ